MRAGEFAHRHHHAGAFQRAALHEIEVAALRRAEVLRVREVLQIVQGDDGGHVAARRHDAAEMMHQLDVVQPQLARQPGIFDQHPPHHMASLRQARDDGMCRRGKLGVLLDEAGQGERDRCDLRARDEWLEQADGVVLGSADDAGHQPQQVERDLDAHDATAR